MGVSISTALDALLEHAGFQIPSDLVRSKLHSEAKPDMDLTADGCWSCPAHLACVLDDSFLNRTAVLLLFLSTDTISPGAAEC